jgi:S1-C subfamily serine protease
MTIFRAALLAAMAAASLAPAVAAAQERTRVAQPRDTAVQGRLSIFTQRRARLGVSVDMRAGANDSIGATIAGVTPGGPAFQAGIRTGDIITHIDGRSLLTGDVRDPEADRSLPALRLTEYVAQLEANDTIRIEYRRDGERRTTTLVTGNEPIMVVEGPAGNWIYRFDWPPLGQGRTIERAREPFGARGEYWVTLGSPLANLELAPLNADLGAYFGTSEGVLVINVPEHWALGLKGGDVVLSVDGRRVTSPSSLLRILRTYEPTENIRLEIMRNRSRQTVTGQIGRRPGER